MRNLSTITKIQITFFIWLTLSTINFTSAQTPQIDKEYVQAMELIQKGSPIIALPILEKIAPRYNNDAEFLAHFGVAIIGNSVTYKDKAKRKTELIRGAEILKKAKKLGTKNVLALHYLDLIENGAEIDSISGSPNKEVEAAIREGEAFYGRGEFEKAFASYEKAFKLDPKSYEAALFAGDTFFAQKKFAESESWFGKAAAINPNREQAFRFWADALASQNKGNEALEKYAQAFIAEPGSRITFDALIEATRNLGKRRSSPFVLIPSKESEAGIIIDPNLIENEAERKIWNNFTEKRKTQIENFNKVANGRQFVPTLIENVEAIKSVATGGKNALQNDKTLKLSKSLENLIKIDSLGMSDVYLMLFVSDENQEYENFREKNRDRMKKFLVDYFANDSL